MGGVEEAGGWRRVAPDEHGDWINQRVTSFDAFLPMGEKGSDEIVLFQLYSNGVKTQRDPWAVNASREALEENVRGLIETYATSVERIRAAGAEGDPAKRLRINDPRRIAWTANLVQDAERVKPLAFDPEAAVRATYRPFTPQWLYYDPRLNERRYRIPSIFPEADTRTRAISISAVGHKGQFSALMVDRPPALHTADMAGSSAFPSTTTTSRATDEAAPDLFDPPKGLTARDGVSDAGLAHFQAAWPGEAITKEDLFHYVYGLLHSLDYRSRYADNLKKALPRIPAVASAQDYRAFRDAGRALADLHVGYEEVEPHPVTYREGDPRTWVVDDPQAFYRVEKMRFGGRRPNLDRTTIHYNDRITLTGIPRGPTDTSSTAKARSSTSWSASRSRWTPTTRRRRRAATSSTTPTASPSRRWAIRLSADAAPTGDRSQPANDGDR